MAESNDNGAPAPDAKQKPDEQLIKSGVQKQVQPPEREEQAEGSRTPRLQKMVDRMKTMATQVPGFQAKRLEGKTLEDQYDLLEFYLDNVPVLEKNQKIVPAPVDVGNQTVNNVTISTDPNTGRRNYSVDLISVLKKQQQK